MAKRESLELDESGENDSLRYVPYEVLRMLSKQRVGWLRIYYPAFVKAVKELQISYSRIHVGYLEVLTRMYLGSYMCAGRYIISLQHCPQVYRTE